MRQMTAQQTDVDAANATASAQVTAAAKSAATLASVVSAVNSSAAGHSTAGYPTAGHHQRKKKLLIASDCFLPRIDGIARFLADIIPTLTSDFDITVVCPDFEGEHLPIKDVRIVRIPLITSFSFGDFSPARIEKSVMRQLIDENDVVWTHTLASIGGTAIQIAKKRKKPYCCYVHSIDWMLVSRALSEHNIIRRPLYWLTLLFAKRAFSRANIVMVPSSEVLEIFEWNNVNAPSRIIRLGIDTNHFAPPKDKRRAKIAVGLDPNSFVIGYVGRLGREKDVLTLYRAFLQFAKKRPTARLLIVGDGIADVKRHMMYNGKVVLAGNQSDVAPYLQAMDIFVLPSLLETTSLATLEAMATQVPVICTPVGLIKEYIREKKNGLLFPIGNSLILSLKLEWLATDALTRQHMGKAARETVMREYTWQHTVDQIKRALASVAKESEKNKAK